MKGIEKDCLVPVAWCFRIPVLLMLTLPASGCSLLSVAPQNRVSVTPASSVLDGSVAVLGVTARSGLKAPLDTSLLVSDFVSLLVARQAFPVLSQQQVRLRTGPRVHDDMLAHYARTGRLAPFQVRLIMQAALPAQRLIIVRLDSDAIQRLPVRREVIKDEKVVQVVPRRLSVFAIRRTTKLSATLLDLASGTISWTRQFSVSPETTRVALELDAPANATPTYPDATPLNVNVRALLDQLVTSIPLIEPR